MYQKWNTTNLYTLINLKLLNLLPHSQHIISICLLDWFEKHESAWNIQFVSNLWCQELIRRSWLTYPFFSSLLLHVNRFITKPFFHNICYLFIFNIVVQNRFHLIILFDRYTNNVQVYVYGNKCYQN